MTAVDKWKRLSTLGQALRRIASECSRELGYEVRGLKVEEVMWFLGDREQSLLQSPEVQQHLDEVVKSTKRPETE